MTKKKDISRNLFLSEKYQGYIRVDFHSHTICSPDSLLNPEQLIKVARKKKIDRVVITDHNEVECAFRAKDLDHELIIIGEEIDTREGEILAIFVKEKIQPGLSPQEVILRLKEQGAFISISHPFDPMRKGGWRVDALLDILPDIDAIETFNSRCMRQIYNQRAEVFAAKHKLLGTHGSDAHSFIELGRGSLLLLPFFDAQSLRESLKKAVSPRLILSSPLIHLTSRYASWVKKMRTR